MARLKEYNGHYCESEYEYAFIGFLEAEGWKYTSGNKLSRVTKRDVLIEDDFKKFIADGNLDLTEDEVTQIYDTVRLVGAESDFATLHKVYNWLVDGIQFTPKDGIARMIPLINFEKDGVKNIFRVVNQFTVEYTNNGQKENRRPDVILFVNGMPLCIMELKNPADANATIYDAWEQINIRYWRDIPHLLHYCPLACISDIYATQVLKEKEEFRATVAPVWVVLNFFLMVTQFRSGLVGTADIRLICISILPLLIATWLGKKLVCKVSQKVFLNLTYILLLISGVSLIV